MVPERVPRTETEIGVELPWARGALSVISKVKLAFEMVMSGFGLELVTPEKVNEPNARLAPEVISVDGCGVKLREMVGPEVLRVAVVEVTPLTVNEPDVE